MKVGELIRGKCSEGIDGGSARKERPEPETGGATDQPGNKGPRDHTGAFSVTNGNGLLNQGRSGGIWILAERENAQQAKAGRAGVKAREGSATPARSWLGQSQGERRADLFSTSTLVSG